MAKKDWKKIEEGDFLVYHNKKTNSYIKLWSPFSGERRFDVVVIVDKKTKEDKTFKRRSQALKFAYTYMKKH